VNTIDGLPTVDGMRPVLRMRTYNGLESWTTCHLGNFGRGHIVQLPGTDYPVVLTSVTREPTPELDYGPMNEESKGRIVGTARRLDDSNALEGFRLLAKTSVLVRCDVVYVDESF
jgi:hypothetical protein